MKKKGKKRSALKNDILTQEHLGPSTSEITRPLPITVNSQKKGPKQCSSKRAKTSTRKNENGCNRNLVHGITDKNLIERVDQNDAAVSTDKPPQCISFSPLAGNGSVGREGNMQNGIMNMLTRGLEGTIVARWDDIEQPSSQIMEISVGKPVSIGYIGDEWDEEYDKGKRKKVRTSITEFGGPNPFQEFATQKTKFKKNKFKKAKFDQSRSANQPFRI